VSVSLRTTGLVVTPYHAESGQRVIAAHQVLRQMAAAVDKYLADPLHPALPLAELERQAVALEDTMNWLQLLMLQRRDREAARHPVRHAAKRAAARRTVVDDGGVMSRAEWEAWSRRYDADRKARVA